MVPTILCDELDVESEEQRSKTTTTTSRFLVGPSGKMVLPSADTGNMVGNTDLRKWY